MTDPTDRSRFRFYPCYLLQDNEIPFAVWFEDALGYYGVSTVVFDLYLLVDDIEVAAQALVRNGWSIVPYDASKINVGFDSKAHRRLLPPPDPDAADKARVAAQTWPLGPRPPPPPSNRPSPPTTTILLPATDWNYKLPEVTKDATAVASFIPPLPDLLDALIDSFLDCEPSMFFSHLSCQVGYLYGYVTELRQASFAENLKYEHRQFHLDWLSGMSVGTVPFAQHERKIRDALREGKNEIQPCSAPRTDRKLFNQAEQAEVHAAMQQNNLTRNSRDRSSGGF
ncbi:hypothetical protein PVAG01_07679 [Phlyctema vagabunda]|uniref:Uncharacterized protein n=1 Tax=Phlyctema vagabunda TaxID=108571 RepID=A0ABR4PD43_9HELO